MFKHIFNNEEQMFAAKACAERSRRAAPTIIQWQGTSKEWQGKTMLIHSLLDINPVQARRYNGSVYYERHSCVGSSPVSSNFPRHSSLVPSHCF